MPATTVTAAIIGTPVHMRDELRTGPEGRLKITFRDDTVLTLGEKASVVIDRYVYDPDRNVGETIAPDDQGRLSLRLGPHQGAEAVATSLSRRRSPISACAAREFWGGPLDEIWGALLEGEVTVSNQAGSVTLSAQARAPTSPRRSIRRARSSPGAQRRLPAPSPPWRCISEYDGDLGKSLATKRRTLKIRHLAGACRSL